MFVIPHTSVVFHVKLLNILGFVHLPEKSLDKYICILKLKETWTLLHVVCFLGWNFCQIFELLNSITKQIV